MAALTSREVVVIREIRMEVTDSRGDQYRAREVCVFCGAVCVCVYVFGRARGDVWHAGGRVCMAWVAGRQGVGVKME